MGLTPTETELDPRPPPHVQQPSLGRVVHVRVANVVGADNLRREVIRPGTISNIDERGWVTAHVFVVPGVDCADGDPPVAVFRFLCYSPTDLPKEAGQLYPSWFWPPIVAPPKPRMQDIIDDVVKSGE